MNVQIEESWKAHLQPEFEKDYFRTLTDFVRDEYGKYAIYPPGKLIFNAFNLCPFDKVKVVIIGQDPYHGPGQAHGLCFSVNDGVPFPPSLLNIFKEIKMTLALMPHYRQSDTLGRARHIAAQCYPHRTCTPSRFSPKPRLGNIYRCGYPHSRRRKRASCIYSLGSLRPT